MALLIQFIIYLTITIFVAAIAVAKIFKIHNRIAFALNILKYATGFETIGVGILAYAHFTDIRIGLMTLVMILATTLVSNLEKWAIHKGHEIHAKRVQQQNQNRYRSRI